MHGFGCAVQYEQCMLQGGKAIVKKVTVAMEEMSHPEVREEDPGQEETICPSRIEWSTLRPFTVPR